MAPQRQVKLSRKQKLLNRKDRGPEAEQKKLFTLARLLEVQKRHEAQPFLSTALGKLPPELRVKIYQQLLVGPQSRADNEFQKVPLATEKALLDGSSSTASPRFIHLKGSGLSILRTCRQINLEASPNFYGSALPYFANAQELSRFLVGIGPTGRSNLEAFRVGSLLLQEPIQEQEVPHYHYDTGVFYLHSEGYISCRRRRTDPEVTGAFNLLSECKNLRRIYMDMSQGEECMHLAIIRTFFNRQHTYLRCFGSHCWYVQRRRELRLDAARPEFVYTLRAYRELLSSGRPMGREILVEVDVNAELYQPRPFHQTLLGKLPPELRLRGYHELVATPPTHAGQELTAQGIRAEPKNANGPGPPTTTFAHLQASCLDILETCRRNYVEAYPLFYARTSYYTDNTKEFSLFMRLGYLFDSPLRSSTITSLCVKNLVSQSKSLHQPQFSLISFVTVLGCYRLAELESLRKLYICMRVGEELGYVELLFRLPRMNRGVIDFLDESHWVLRLQNPEEEWKVQYACFLGDGWKKGKGDVELSFDEIDIQRRILMNDTQAPGLEQGQERFVEVDINAPLEKRMHWKMLAMVDKFGALSIGSGLCDGHGRDETSGRTLVP